MARWPPAHLDRGRGIRRGSSLAQPHAWMHHAALTNRCTLQQWPDQLDRFLRLTYCVSKSVRVRASARTDERPRRQFVVGYLFGYTCFEGTRGTVRVHTDGTMAPANFKAQG